MTGPSDARRHRGEDAVSRESGARDGSETQAKKPYAPPRLECYGKLSEVTRFGGSRVVDSGSGLGNQPLVP